MKSFFDGAAPWALTVTVTEGDTAREAKAFLEPLSLTSPEAPGTALPAGVADERRYLLIAAPEAIQSETGPVSITAEGRVFELLRRERFPGGHWEGVLRLKAGEADA